MTYQHSLRLHLCSEGTFITLPATLKGHAVKMLNIFAISKNNERFIAQVVRLKQAKETDMYGLTKGITSLKLVLFFSLGHFF